MIQNLSSYNCLDSYIFIPFLVQTEGIPYSIKITWGI